MTKPVLPITNLLKPLTNTNLSCLLHNLLLLGDTGANLLAEHVLLFLTYWVKM